MSYVGAVAVVLSAAVANAVADLAAECCVSRLGGLDGKGSCLHAVDAKAGENASIATATNEVKSWCGAVLLFSSDSLSKVAWSCDRRRRTLELIPNPRHYI